MDPSATEAMIPLEKSDGAKPETHRRRAQWRERRKRMEVGGRQSTVRGVRRLRYWGLLEWASAALALGLRLAGLYRRGMKNAMDVRLTTVELEFDELPKVFDGYRLLHLTDLHVDFLPQTFGAVLARVKEVESDLCVMTGDYHSQCTNPNEETAREMGRLVPAIRAEDGIYATLGNHDDASMVDALEALGVRMLINESVPIARGGERIWLTGLDDVHYFYSEDATRALREAPEGFKVAAVHSPEAAAVAAEAGFALYLSGHTHGGQINLPDGRPIITTLALHREYAAGWWKCGQMTGFTSSGAGVSSLPVRFNSRGEVTLIRLRRRAPSRDAK